MKKIIVLALAIIGLLSISCVIAFADSEITVPIVFSAHFSEEIPIGDKTVTVDEQHPYVVSVPETINVVSEDASTQTISDNSKLVYVVGYTINPVSVNIKASSIAMTSNITGTSKTATASLSTVTLPYTVDEAGTYSNPLSVKWNSGNTPATGSDIWTGTVEYTIS